MMRFDDCDADWLGIPNTGPHCPHWRLLGTTGDPDDEPETRRQTSGPTT